MAFVLATQIDRLNGITRRKSDETETVFFELCIERAISR